MTLTVAVSYGLRRYLCRESIYTMKLTRRGHYMPQALQANAHLVHHISDMALDPATILPASAPVDRLDLNEDPGPPFCVVLVDGDRVTGVIPRDWALGHPTRIRSARTLGDVGLKDYVTISRDATIVDLLALFVASHASPCGRAIAPGLGGRRAERGPRRGRRHKGDPRGDARRGHGALR
jgi:CIC family chloride channel protein